MATASIVPRADGEGSIGVAAKKWSNVHTGKLNDALITTTPGAGNIPKANASGVLEPGWYGGEKAPVVHKHAISDVTGLQEALANAGTAAHTHAITDVTGLSTALAGKASSTHGHAISEIMDLQTTLNGKSATTHTHTYAVADISGLQSALDGKSATSHTHTYAVTDITGLSDALAGKAASSHGHAISDITSLQTTLDGKAYLSHLHDSTYLNLTGGTLTGVLTAQNNTSYTTKQTRNITLSTAAASGGGNGDVWLQYE